MVKKKTFKIDCNKYPIVVDLFNDAYLNNGIAVYNYKGNSEKQKKWIKASSQIGRISKDVGKDFLYPPATNRVNRMGFVIIPPNINMDKIESSEKIMKFELKKLF